tara:strand:- start:76 stop:333 length:258 start_codon:yes stop_codon:yes gene_type:complete
MCQSSKCHTTPLKPTKIPYTTKVIGRHPMLTTTETIEKRLSPSELISLDTQKVFEAYCAALDAKDKQQACEYAKVFMMKAFAVSR